MASMESLWAVVGPALAGVAALMIVFMGRAWGMIPDAVYAGACLLWLGGRWLDNPSAQPPREAYCVGSGMLAISVYALARVLSLVF